MTVEELIIALSQFDLDLNVEVRNKFGEWVHITKGPRTYNDNYGVLLDD